jgi:inorganic pyrophosphatase
MVLFLVFHVTLDRTNLFVEQLQVISTKTKKAIMADRLSDPIERLIGLRYKSHPWQELFIDKDAPENVVTFIKVVPIATVKYEIEKESGYLKIDKPQKYSNVVPAIYGFIPQTYCGDEVGRYCMEKRRQGWT